jgi:tRNA G10  N-methylase Trm11
MTKSSNLIKYGDSFRLGNHLLLCADSRNKDMVSKLIGKHKIKAVITDVPYGVGLVEGRENFQQLSKNKIIANDHIQSDEEWSLNSNRFLFFQAIFAF